MTEQHYDADWMRQTLARLADEAGASLSPDAPLAVVGIRTRGAVLAERLCALLRDKGRDADLGRLDITMYRDDISAAGGRKAVRASDIPFDLTGRHVLLVDDVLSTGRTIRAAITELMDFGRPAVIRLLCLIDRDRRELPIQPDFAGAQVDVAPERKLQVRVVEVDGVDEVAVT